MLQELSNWAEHSLAECTQQLPRCVSNTFTPGSIRSSDQTCAGGKFFLEELTMQSVLWVQF